MQISTHIQCSLPFSGTPEQAVTFIQNPMLSLAKVRAMQGVTVASGQVQGKLKVAAPVLGDVFIPFVSDVILQPEGASLQAHSLKASEKGWAEIQGKGWYTTGYIHYDLPVVVIFELPPALKWGGKAMQKMVDAAAQSTIEKIKSEFPKALEQAIAEFLG